MSGSFGDEKPLLETSNVAAAWPSTALSSLLDIPLDVVKYILNFLPVNVIVRYSSLFQRHSHLS